MPTFRTRIYKIKEVLRRSLRLVPSPGELNFGDLRRTRPLSSEFGTDRGGAIDRYYIERYLEQHATDIYGRVLEFGDDGYTRRFGGERVTDRQIWHVDGSNPRATIVGDLADAPHVAAHSFDCIILTQTLQYVSDPAAGMATLHRILKPGGVLFATVPGISPVATRSQWGPSWYWAFTERGMARMLLREFGTDGFEVETFGNVLAATALLYGLSPQELTERELLDTDPDYPVTVAARAWKARVES